MRASAMQLDIRTAPLSQLLEVGEQLAREHRSKDALRMLSVLVQRCRNSDPNQPAAVERVNLLVEALFARSRVYGRLSDWSPAVDDLTQLILLLRSQCTSLYFRLAEAYQLRAQAYWQHSQISRCISDCDCALKENPRLVDALLCRAVAFVSTKHFRSAMADLTQATFVLHSFSPGQPVVGCPMLERCENDCSSELSKRKSDATLFACRSRTLFLMGRLKEAIADYRRSVELDASLKSPEWYHIADSAYCTARVPKRKQSPVSDLEGKSLGLKRSKGAASYMQL